jgi:hypothetical protein
MWQQSLVGDAYPQFSLMTECSGGAGIRLEQGPAQDRGHAPDQAARHGGQGVILWNLALDETRPIWAAANAVAW